uniref:Ras-related protein RABH1b n=1 Tax=Rhizophora mucronata TaxID=61149 RepID=A0A2P2LP47_RHIMU
MNKRTNHLAQTILNNRTKPNLIKVETTFCTIHLSESIKEPRVLDRLRLVRLPPQNLPCNFMALTMKQSQKPNAASARERTLQRSNGNAKACNEMLLKYKKLWVSVFEYQQAHPPDCCCDCDAFVLEDLRLTSTMSSCLVEESVSIPGKAAAIFLKSAFILKPAFALVSINMTLRSRALASPSSIETCLLSTRSVLFPTSTIITSLPRSVRTSSIHFEVFRNDCLLATS